MGIINLTPEQERECERSMIEMEKEFGPNIYEQADPFPCDDFDCEVCEFDEYYAHSACIKCEFKQMKRGRR